MRFTRWMVVAGILLAGRAGVAQDEAAADGTPGPTELSTGSAAQGKTESILVTVQSVEDDKITVKDAANQSHEFAIDESTKYVQAGRSLTKDDINEGDRVRAVFVQQDDGTLQASAFQLVRSASGAATGTGAGDAATDTETGTTGDTGMGTGVTGDTGMGTGATGDTGMGTGATGDTGMGTGATGDTGMGTGATGDTGMGTGATGDTGMGTGATGDTGMGTGATGDTGMGTGATGDTGMGTGATGDTGMGTGATGDTGTEYSE